MGTVKGINYGTVGLDIDRLLLNLADSDVTAHMDKKLTGSKMKIKVLAETLSWSESEFSDAVNGTVEAARLYDMPQKRVRIPENIGKVSVVNESILTVARRLAGKGYKVAVLDSADPFEPGGGLTIGEGTSLEESLCLCTTLYPVLDSSKIREDYYEKNKWAYDLLVKGYVFGVYPANVLYLPEIMVLRDDNAMVNLDDPFPIDVMVCAPPRLENEIPFNAMDHDLQWEYINDIRGRIHNIFRVAYEQKVEALILCAFGCGAFHNDSARICRELILAAREYGGNFKEVVLAVPSKEIFDMVAEWI